MKTLYSWLFLAAVFSQIITHNAYATGFTVTNTQMILPSDSNGGPQIIKSSNISNDGSFLFAGATDKSHSLFLKVDPKTKKEWQKIVSQPWPMYTAHFIFDSTDGGYWGIGYAFSRDIREEGRSQRKMLQTAVQYNYLLKMDSQGNPLKQQSLSKDNKWHNIDCGVAARDGLILIGEDTLPDKDKSEKSGKNITYDAPWIEKIDTEGKVLWQKTLAQDSDVSLHLPFNLSDQNKCRGLIVSSAGNIIWAITVEDKIAEDGGPRAKSQTIVLELNSAGDELRSTLSKDADNAFLLPGTSGYTLVEQFRPHVPDSIYKLSPIAAFSRLLPIVNSDGGIRITALDFDLHVLKKHEYKIPAFNTFLGDVYSKVKDEYFIAGCNNDGIQSIAHIDTHSDAVDVSKINPDKGVWQCAHFGWTQNKKTGDLILYDGNTLNGERLLTINYH